MFEICRRKRDSLNVRAPIHSEALGAYLYESDERIAIATTFHEFHRFHEISPREQLNLTPVCIEFYLRHPFVDRIFQASLPFREISAVLFRSFEFSRRIVDLNLIDFGTIASPIHHVFNTILAIFEGFLDRSLEYLAFVDFLNFRAKLPNCFS